MRFILLFFFYFSSLFRLLFKLFLVLLCLVLLVLILLIVLCGSCVCIVVSILILLLFLSTVVFLILLNLRIGLASGVAPVDKSISVGRHLRLLLLIYILLLLQYWSCFKVPTGSYLFFLLGLLQLPSSIEIILLLLEARVENVFRLLSSRLMTIEYL